MPARPAAYGDLAEYLISGYWNWSGYGGAEPRSWADTTIYYNDSDMALADRTRIDLALDLWSDVTGIKFVQTTASTAKLWFINDNSGAYTTMTTSGNDITKATVNISSSWSGGATADLYGYRTHTFIHEIGHALGLGHQGPYNGSADYAANAIFTNDSWQMSVMSYFSQDDNPTIDASYSYVMTPMLADIMAMQSLYGVAQAHVGNTVYGVGNNTGEASFGIFKDNSFPAITIYDTGGIDRLDYSGTSLAQVISLIGGAVSNIYGEVGNLVIFPDSVIENATGGRGVDTIIGNNVANVLIGNAGNDKLEGNKGDDQLFGGLNNDRLQGGAGADTLNGDEGRDTVSYAKSTAGVSVNLGTGVVAGGDATGDKLASIENAIGSKHADVLVGSNAANVLTGGLGLDTLTGGGGADRFDFNKITETGIGASAADVVTDFQSGIDRFDFSTIDASTVVNGNDAFTWLGTGAFSTSSAGELRFEQVDTSGTDYTMVWGDVDGDTSAEFSIKLLGLINLTSADFIL